MTRNVHLVGSFPIADVEEVFLLQNQYLRGFLHRYVAGSTFSADALENKELLQFVRSAYAAFDRMRTARKLPLDARMQFSIALPLGAVRGEKAGFADNQDRKNFGALLLKFFAELATAVPARDLAVQIELPLADLREASAGGAPPLLPELHDVLVDSALRAVSAIPLDAQAIVHFDCRDGARYKMSRLDMAAMVSVSNSLMRGDANRVALLHFPTPLKHDDDSFFRRLGELKLSASTELCLGLIHLSDGLEGAMRRIDFAKVHFSDFYVAARSGFRARTVEQIDEFLELHARVSAAHPEERSKETCS